VLGHFKNAFERNGHGMDDAPGPEEDYLDVQDVSFANRQSVRGLRLDSPSGPPPVRTAVSAKLNLLKKTTFYNLRVSEFTRVYKCPVFGARRNGYGVSEVKDRRERSNELYEQVAALG
jgi:hypothetical protein